ncbi:MAG: hypothetical protein CMC39_05145 [Flavobacteriaceae bacterium]|nr:hypothetical protein [Flavobacteriaceae bacterium]
MKRRNFIKLTASASAIGLFPGQITNALNIGRQFINCDISNRKLVLIYLGGGNDGLNTIIPLNQYDLYSNLRPTLKIPETGTNGYINLDTTLLDEQQIGLHPSLNGFKNLYDSGFLRILQAVGYPSQNKSHFASTDVYNTGNDGNSWLNGGDSGWIGRFIEAYYYDLVEQSFPIGVEIGSKTGSLGFHGAEEHGLSINIEGQDASGFYSILSGLGGEAPSYIPNSHYGEELQYIIDNDQISTLYSEAISNAFNNGTNSSSYEDSDLSSQLKTVARLISGGLQSKVYLVKLNGFDTHFNQIQSGNDIQGDHNELLIELNNAVSSFMNDISAQGFHDDVVGLTFSEFGRKAKENGNLGTDHGEIAPMFVFGSAINGGVSGSNPDLTEATLENNWQLETFQYDYRETLGTLLQDYLGADDNAIDSTFFNHSSNESFTENKISELIKPEFSVEENCYSNTLSNPTSVVKYFTILPNPFQTEIKIINSEYENIISYEIFDLNARMVKSGVASLNKSIKLDNIINGIYFIKIKFDNRIESHRIIKSY